MNDFLSQTAKDYLRELRHQLRDYKVDDATSAALLADARDGLTGLDDDDAAAQIDRLGWPEEVAKNAAQEQLPVLERTEGIAIAGWICFGLGIVAVALAFSHPLLGVGLALAAFVWAVAGYRHEPKDYRFARWAAVAALIVNALVWIFVIGGAFMFAVVGPNEEVSEPVEVGSPAVLTYEWTLPAS